MDQNPRALSSTLTAQDMGPTPALSTSPVEWFSTPQSTEIHPSDSVPSAHLPMYAIPEEEIPLFYHPLPSQHIPDDGESNTFYGRIPQRVPRRYKTLKKVE
jgi:hypothetical protein